ncbi:MAG: class I SAM-dependent methyltransferase [Cyclobacteriaceae bacterium]
MKRFYLIIILVIPLLANSQYKDIYKESAWAERDEWQEVPRILEAMDISPNSVVADLGCHQGYMTVKLAEELTSGKIYAIDIDSWKLEKLEDLLVERGLSEQVEVIEGEEDNPKLPIGELDAVLIMDTYHEMDDYMEILSHVKTSLKPGGRLVLIEPVAPERESWSRKRQADKHEVSIRYACRDLQKAGFKIIHEENPFIDRRDIKHDILWMLVAVK